MIPLNHYLVLGAIVFAIAVAGIFLNRKNLIVILDGHRADAALGEHELRRLLALPRATRRGRCSCSSSSPWRAAESAIGLAILVIALPQPQVDQRRRPWAPQRG